MSSSCSTKENKYMSTLELGSCEYNTPSIKYTKLRFHASSLSVQVVKVASNSWDLPTLLLLRCVETSLVLWGTSLGYDPKFNHVIKAYSPNFTSLPLTLKWISFLLPDFIFQHSKESECRCFKELFKRHALALSKSCRSSNFDSKVLRANWPL